MEGYYYSIGKTVCSTIINDSYTEELIAKHTAACTANRRCLFISPLTLISQAVSKIVQRGVYQGAE